jgi:hypothetical protein
MKASNQAADFVPRTSRHEKHHLKPLGPERNKFPAGWNGHGLGVGLAPMGCA